MSARAAFILSTLPPLTNRVITNLVSGLRGLLVYKTIFDLEDDFDFLVLFEDVFLRAISLERVSRLLLLMLMKKKNKKAIL